MDSTMLGSKSENGKMHDIPLTPVDKGSHYEVGPTVSFHNVNYIVNDKIDKRRVEKYVLKEVTGIFRPGMNAILGPSGSGKTSLLDLLAARKDKRGFTGTVLLDGRPLPSNFKNISGYVVQDDVVMGTLTVRENLAFSAALRLPKTVSSKQREQRVEDIIVELGLTACANTKVGTEFIRGVSGGERKRVNIGMELIIKPGVLFLDEPTTGLDASTASSVISLLHSLSLKGRTIVFSIHQPRFSIFRHFDTIHLLSKGGTVFHGPADNALEYFASIGFECEEHNNPPDFFLDVIEEEKAPIQYVTGVEKDVENGGVEPSNGHQKSLVQKFSESTYCTRVNQEVKEIITSGKEVDTRQPKGGYATSFLVQLYHVSGRTVKNLARDPANIIFQPLLTIIFAVIVGLFFWQLDTSASSGIQNRVGACFFIITNMMFSNASAVETFIRQRVIFIHETASGYYRVSAFFIAKVFLDLVPMRIVPTVLYSVISYWMMGFKNDAGSFFFFALMLLLATLSGTGVAFFFGASINKSGLSTLATTATYVVMLVFGGLFLNIDSLPRWIQWIQYFSIVRFGLNGLTVNELRDVTFCDETNSTVPGCPLMPTCVVGDEYLSNQGIPHKTLWDMWQNAVALACISSGLLLLSYVQLRRIPKSK